MGHELDRSDSVTGLMVSINGRLVEHMFLINRVLAACLIGPHFFKQFALQMNFTLLIAHTFVISFTTLLKFLH